MLQFFNRAVIFFRGKKTYLCIIGAGISEGLFVFGYLTPDQHVYLLKVFTFLGGASFVAKMNRIGEALKTANNLTLRQTK